MLKCTSLLPRWPSIVPLRLPSVIPIRVTLARTRVITTPPASLPPRRHLPRFLRRSPKIHVSRSLPTLADSRRSPWQYHGRLFRQSLRIHVLVTLPFPFALHRSLHSTHETSPETGIDLILPLLTTCLLGMQLPVHLRIARRDPRIRGPLSCPPPVRLRLRRHLSRRLQQPLLHQPNR